MKATARCPKCGKVLTTDCEGCISSGTSVHLCKDNRKGLITSKVKWKVIDCTKQEAKILESLGFKGDIPELLE